jgi:hypothetical protein
VMTLNDKLAQQRLLMNSKSIPVVMKLCEFSSGSLQVMSFDILDWISQLNEGVDLLIENDVLSLLCLPQLTYLPNTPLRVKHGAVKLISKITAIYPSLFPVDSVVELALDAAGFCRIDIFMETTLMHSFVHHLQYLNNQNLKLFDKEFALFPYLIGKIISEIYGDFDYLYLILTAIFLVSKDRRHVEYMLAIYFHFLTINYELLRFPQ